MTTLYQRIALATRRRIGAPRPLPEDVPAGLDADGLLRLGDTLPQYRGVGFVAADPPGPPVEIERLWALLALQGAGLLDLVEAAIAEADRAVQIYWRDAGSFRRDSAILIEFATGLGLTSDQLDDLFRHAASLKAFAEA